MGRALISIIILMLINFWGCKDNPAGVEIPNPDFKVAYTSYGLDSLYIINLEGDQKSALVELKDLCLGVDWLPDSKAIIYTKSNYDSGTVWLYNLETDNNRQLISLPDAAIGQPHVSVDGKYLVFTAGKTNNLGVYICKLNIDGSNFTELTSPNEYTYFIDWSPDNNSILYTLDTQNSDLWSLDINTLNRKRLTERPYSVFTASYSPDGSKIVCSVNDSLYNYSIMIMNADGTDKQFITPFEPHSKIELHWSPDGKSIAVIQYDNSLFANIYLLNQDDNSMKLLSPLYGHHYNLHWINDELISFCLVGGNIWIISRDGKQLWEVTDLKNDETGNIKYAVSKVKI